MALTWLTMRAQTGRGLAWAALASRRAKGASMRLRSFLSLESGACTRRITLRTSVVASFPAAFSSGSSFSFACVRRPGPPLEVNERCRAPLAVRASMPWSHADQNEVSQTLNPDK